MLCVGHASLRGPQVLDQKRKLRSRGDPSSPRPVATWTARSGGSGMRVGSGTRGWQEWLLCGLQLCRDLLTGEGRASLLSWVLFWCPRWVPLEGGRTWEIVGGPPGQEQPWSETLPQGGERSPRAVVPRRTAPAPALFGPGYSFFQSGTSLESQKMVPAVQVPPCRKRGRGRAWPGFRAPAFSPAEPFVCG